LVFTTGSAAETMSLGRRLADRLEAGAVVAFHGELGSGKTTMIKGVCAGLGVSETVKSPSFVIVTEYAGRLPVFHLDLYRVAVDSELDGLGLEDYFEGAGVCLVEWAERCESRLPRDAVRVRLESVPGGRRIVVEGLAGLA
jgi:tRNA threonylcarbamoyladenosine biosynthesis protein TsaE